LPSSILQVRAEEGTKKGEEKMQEEGENEV